MNLKEALRQVVGYDNVAVTPDRSGTGTPIATETLTPSGGTSADYQVMKLAVGKRDEYEGEVGGRTVDGDTNRSAQFVDPRPLVKRMSVNAVTSISPAYSAKDNIGGALDFVNAARASGGTVVIQSIQLVDIDHQDSAMDLVFFDRVITAPTDNAAFAPTNAELRECIGLISVAATDWHDMNTNSVAAYNNVGLEAVLNGTDLFGYLVSRGTPTYTTVASLTVMVTVLQD